MTTPCACTIAHPPRLVVVTGGPGAGKTAVLEVAQRQLCRHVVVLPEAASILWRGQFPRHATLPGRRAAQRTIVRLQLEMQRMAVEEGEAALIICDRGTLDGLAYWPGSEPERPSAPSVTTWRTPSWRAAGISSVCRVGSQTSTDGCASSMKYSSSASV